MLVKCRCGKTGPLYGQMVKSMPDGEQISGRCSVCGREITIFQPFEKPVEQLEPFPPFPEPEPMPEEPVVAPVEPVARVKKYQPVVDEPALPKVRVKIKPPVKVRVKRTAKPAPEPVEHPRSLPPRRRRPKSLNSWLAIV